MTAPLPVPSAQAERALGPAFDTLPSGLVLIGAPPAVGKTCLSLNLAAHYAAFLGEAVLYVSPAQPKEVLAARLAKNLAAPDAPVDPASVNGLPLVVLDEADITSADLLESVTAYVEREGQPAIVLVNDLQSLRPGDPTLKGLDAAVEIMADLRAVAKICDAPVALFSQLSEGKAIATAVCELADRVITVGVTGETPHHKALSVKSFDPPEPDATVYPLSLCRDTGVIGAA